VALADFPAVVRALEDGQHLARAPFLRSVLDAGYRAWLVACPKHDDAHALLACINQAWHEARRKRDPKDDYKLEMEKAFDKRWEDAKRWHWNIIGESVFFTGLILLSMWPWLRKARPWRWAVHFALLPVLFALPYWLGYAWLTFTSAGPYGGVLYPSVLLELRGLPRIGLDGWIIRNLPKFLADYSHSPGAMMSLSGGGGAWPTAMVVIGALLGLVVYEVRTAQTVSSEATLSGRIGRWFAKPRAALKADEPPAAP
jgi:hypothetical protein